MHDSHAAFKLKGPDNEEDALELVRNWSKLLKIAKRRYESGFGRNRFNDPPTLVFSSPTALEPLGARHAGRMYARVSEGMGVLLRYFDPRVFESLLAVLEERQRSDFLNPADCWWYVGRSGSLLRQCAQYAAMDPNISLELSASQEFALLDASEIDQLAAHLESMLPD